ncbi:NepR family anti-sigma factor [Qingshengfaniella alkalisoli]|uniref:NepR family anti-sigma factor n=1 Tax=Qingshengfaniella alkalisoli TaxID=2599296 RepID=UPI00143D6AD3|nr:NepR family anti-sigma factor [Qingshengfaniella alkalisoli]
MAKENNETGHEASGRPSRHIDDNLKRIYQETLSEELPDRFTELLAKLRDKDTSNEPS